MADKWYGVGLHGDGTAEILTGPGEHADARKAIDRYKGFGVILTTEEVERIRDRIGTRDETVVLQEGGVVAEIGEAGPEAVIPLDSPEAVEVMAEAIEEAGAGDEAEVEAAVEIAKVEADAAVEIVEAQVEAEVEIAKVEADAEVAVVEAEVEAASEVAEAETEAVVEVAEEAADLAEEGAPTEAVEAVAEVAEDVAPMRRGLAKAWWGE